MSPVEGISKGVVEKIAIKRAPLLRQSWCFPVKKSNFNQNLNSGGFGKCAAGGRSWPTFLAWGGARGRGAAPGLRNPKEGKLP